MVTNLVWLGPEINSSPENIITQDKLRNIVPDIQIFDGFDKCRNYICALSNDKRVILIVTRRLAEELVPQIHHLPCIVSIYVFCIEQEAALVLKEKFKKVIKCFCTLLVHLFIYLGSRHYHWLRQTGIYHSATLCRSCNGRKSSSIENRRHAAQPRSVFTIESCFSSAVYLFSLL
jgi:hypothetical protein